MSYIKLSLCYLQGELHDITFITPKLKLELAKTYIFDNEFKKIN